MTFISYAQNLEDLVLWRALKHVERGFYIDIGAFSPDLDSVTRAFSERGWHGINVEPNPHYLAQLIARRPHDINLGVAVSDFDGHIELHVVGDTGLTTTSTDLADTHSKAGWEVNRIDVPARTLASLWKDHVPADQPVHFLKVDVEGHEAAVLRGADWSHNRPWILAVEATVPLTQVPSYEDWNGILEEARYDCVYWDGLSRFYLAREHGELAGFFSSPPSIFDDFRPVKYQEALEELNHLRRKLAEQKSTENYIQERKEALRIATEARCHVERLLYTVTSEAHRSALQLNYLHTRSFWETLLFRKSGRPTKALRKLLFHTSGKPRGMFKRWVFHRDGRPRKPFRMWIMSDYYRALPRAVIIPQEQQLHEESALPPRVGYFTKRLRASKVHNVE